MDFFWRKHPRFCVDISQPLCCYAGMAPRSRQKAGHRLALLHSSLQGCERYLAFKAQGEKAGSTRLESADMMVAQHCQGQVWSLFPQPSPDPFGSSRQVLQLLALCPPLCLHFCSCGPILHALRWCKPRRGSRVVLCETHCPCFRPDAARPSGLPHPITASSHWAPTPWNDKAEQEQGALATVLMQGGQRLCGPTRQEVGKDSLEQAAPKRGIKGGR